MQKTAFLFFILFTFFAAPALGAGEINLFYSQTCPHCKAEREFLADLSEKYPEIQINEYEVVSNAENRQLLAQFYERYNVPERERGRVPITFTEKEYFVGFSDQIANNLENCIKECIGQESEDSQSVRLPFLGPIDVSSLSLPMMTIVFGALDGFNPCAMWVLILLIVLLINTRSRKRMWLIGGTFLLASGIIYYLILAAWLNLFLAISYVNITRIIIGALAVGFGVWQIRTFFTYQPGTCKVMDGKSSFQERLKQKLTKHTENLVSSPLTLGILGGVMLLAFGINLIEFFCSSGLPAIYTRILSLNELGNAAYYSYLLLYTFVFMLDDLIIFTVAVVTLSRFGLNEKYNYWSTLIGGVLILLLGLLLIFKPELLMFV